MRMVAALKMLLLATVMSFTPLSAGTAYAVAQAEPSFADNDGTGGSSVEPDDNSSGSAQRAPGDREPSEDGTEDGPDIIVPGQPDSPPGCIFHQGPLELVV